MGIMMVQRLLNIHTQQQQQQMSIYSGFATRKDETNYNHLLERLIETLQSHLMKLVDPLKVPEHLSTRYSKIISKMRQYQQHKYLKPKFSELLDPLAQLIGLPEKLDTIHQKVELSFSSSAYRQQFKSNNSHSHSKINSKKNSHGVSFMQNEDPSSRDRRSETGMMWQVNTKVGTPKHQKEKEFRNTKTTVKHSHDNFYSIHERKIKKASRVIQRRQYDESTQARKSLNHVKNRSVTEPQPFQSKDFILKDKRLIDLKVLKEAQQLLKKGQSSQRRYRIKEQVSFTSEHD